MKTIQKLTFLLLLILSNLYYCHAQQDTLHGHLIDAETREALIGGNIYITNRMLQGTVSDIDGYFALSLLDRNREVTFSYDALMSLRFVPKTAYKIDALMRWYRLSNFQYKWYQWKRKKAAKKEEQSDEYMFKGILRNKDNRDLAGVPIKMDGKEIAATDVNGHYEIKTSSEVDGVLIIYPAAYGDTSVLLKEKVPVEAVLVWR
ncbi:MAG: hypothetical protein AAF806_20730 [Bacteroidota bacterium]